MTGTQWSALRHDPQLRLDSLQARFTRHAFARHWHDYYVVGLVEEGAQTFWCRRATHATPRGGLILINPGEAHTGEAADGRGFSYRALYPKAEHLAPLMAELGRPTELPSFPSLRVDDQALAAELRRLHGAAEAGHPAMARETVWMRLLTALILRYGGERLALPRVGAEPRAVARARALIEARYAEGLTLAALGEAAALSPFHLVRAFHRAHGVPPHVYLESVRIREAQRLLATGAALADVAYAVGFSSQSHFTTRFRRVLGVTPGQYRAAL
jgi:AraC-like DNA-binding protein